MSKKPKITHEEMEAFYAAVKGTRPLVHKNKKIPVKTPASPSRQATQQRKSEMEEVNLKETQDLEAVEGEEFIAFKQAGISNKTLRKLRKGQYNVDAILDLHGMSVEEAKTAVESFLKQCLFKRLKVVLIIHGKGHHSQMPILKNKLNHWLRELNTVLAFCSAAPTHGSRGAIYILLKRSVEEGD